jgi:hypothetical protein
MKDMSSGVKNYLALRLKKTGKGNNSDHALIHGFNPSD